MILHCLPRCLQWLPGQVITCLLDLAACKGASGKDLFKVVEEALEENGVPWDKLVGFASDNANNVAGNHNSVKSRVLQMQPFAVAIGCTCHSSALVASAAAQKLPPWIMDLLQSMINWFKNSPQRIEALAGVQLEELTVGAIASMQPGSGGGKARQLLQLASHEVLRKVIGFGLVSASNLFPCCFQS
jgi:hypothetical protein